jgi:hypothetical protein
MCGREAVLIDLDEEKTTNLSSENKLSIYWSKQSNLGLGRKRKHTVLGAIS